MNLWTSLPKDDLPSTGDTVTRTANFAPLTVRSHCTDRYGQLWLCFENGSKERVECLRWYPREGDKVTVNIAIFAQGLKVAMDTAPENSAQMMSLKKLSDALTLHSSWVYRNHTLSAIKCDRATILDSKGVARSLGLRCLVVVERSAKPLHKPLEQLSLL